MISICRNLEIEQTVSHYAIELFDKFFTSLIENAPKFGLMEELSVNSELNSYFGQNIWNLLELKMRFDSLYFQVVPNNDFCKYGRIICMVICLFIASKQCDNKHVKISKLRQFLLSYGVPSYFIDLKRLLSLEDKVLNIINFELNITTLQDFIETQLFILIRETKLSNTKAAENYFTKESISKIHIMALTLMENYYMLQIPFLVQLFQTYQNHTFNLCSLEEIEKIENLSRDKILISAIIVAASCILVNQNFDNKSILSHISYISGTKNDFIQRGCISVLKVLYVDLYQNRRKGLSVFTFE